MAELTEYHRLCPICGKMIYHTSKNNLDKMVKKNSPCRECFYKTRYKYDVDTFVRSCHKCGKKKVFSGRHSYSQSVNRGEYTCGCCLRKGKPIHTDDSRDRIRISKLGIPRDENVKRKVSKTRRKQRAENFLRFGMYDSKSNPAACQFISRWGTEHGYNFRHGQNGGEFYVKDVGAFVDGYDVDKNIVFEYDEPAHYDRRGNLKTKDVRRMLDIIETLHCRFVRYNEKTQTITEYSNL